MKQFKIVIMVFLMLFSFTIYSNASSVQELETRIELEKKAYEELRQKALSLYESGVISKEEYDSRIEKYNNEETYAIEQLEEEIILQKENEQGVGWEDQKPNITTNYDENGNKITDYTNFTDEQIQALNNCRTLSFETVVQEGTSIVDDFYIKVKISGYNFTFEREVILDASNKYQQSIYVPNGIYNIDYESSTSANSLSYTGSYIDASTSPTNYVYVTGGRQIISDEKEIIKIEGDKITEVPEEENQISKEIIIVIISIIGIIGLAVAIFFAIKRKRELEL